MNSLDRPNSKNSKFVIDKISHSLSGHFDTNSLSAWLSYYYAVYVKGAPEKTEQAKKKDLAKFIQFFQNEVGHDVVDSWTPSMSKHFQKKLVKTISEKTGKPFKATSINRTMATIRHVGRWLHQQRPLLAGDPLAQVKDLQTDAPDWNGLTSKQMMRLKSACEQRIKSCTRNHQNPSMEAALFYLLMGTGLRASEVVSLNVEQYYSKGLHLVLRHKSKRVSNKIALPQESRDYLERYLQSRGDVKDEPLFVTRYNTRLQTLDVYRICQRVLKQAIAFLPEHEKFEFTPHKLRHTFLKKVTDKQGVHFAQELSGNVVMPNLVKKSYNRPLRTFLHKACGDLLKQTESIKVIEKI